MNTFSLSPSLSLSPPFPMFLSSSMEIVLAPDLPQLTPWLLTISVTEINLNLFIPRPSFESHRCFPECSNGTWGYKHEKGSKRLRGDRSLFWLCFPFFYSGVSPGMILYRCLKGVGLHFFRTHGISLHPHWKDFSDLQTGRQPDTFLVFIQLLLPVWL